MTVVKKLEEEPNKPPVLEEIPIVDVLAFMRGEHEETAKDAERKIKSISRALFDQLITHGEDHPLAQYNLNQLQRLKENKKLTPYLKKLALLSIDDFASGRLPLVPSAR